MKPTFQNHFFISFNSIIQPNWPILNFMSLQSFFTGNFCLARVSNWCCRHHHFVHHFHSSIKLEPNLSVLSDILLIRKTHLPMSLFDWFGIDFVPIRRNWLKILKICLWTKVWLEIAASSQFEIPKRTKNRF